ncbi:zf-HC2 domain-containing protein [Duganella sp. BJB1802]|uniref:anti-sigma factor family protein n=1 Tax=Duganella sp. BJB1802 TaxID=2744575 RepID=UPI002811675B|nr:hypothetical protein [Duganella sp. BJB1802]
MNSPVTEAELQAWVDGRLPPERRGAVDAHLALHPADAARLQAYRDHDDALRALYRPVLEQPVPPAMTARVTPPAQPHGWRGWLAPGSGPPAADPCAWPPCWR